ncbi:ABC transporter substrate-binding protein [Pseudomonas syringae group genomosp. 3]|uniref:Iron compound ABC transporter, iron compound-binding protein n=1 Tax=Pseudomonas syringae pv. tomato (strain ATCC BAA-871 / DC3000) TaxID=223283 RepID=Q87TV8_PSESM|nr:ABC transporter substrate-binding protein [Pseudomonas syringae group genomosp. 3]AAO58981.1 iron compound ABC transporter, iron compound-binding protein [Pseudomonas syringae pv. tomato str. DC3000]KPY97195.1 Iron compound ABC transporter, iron compound-binding protein [Pseudomonas syringae pv. tomato]
MNALLTRLALVMLLCSPMAHAAYPVTVQSCDRSVTFTAAPQRAVSNDVNLTKMMVALGLQSHMVGYSGITGWNKPDQALLHDLGNLPELASKYPSLETLLNANADFYFAGWNYGMRVGGDVTPQSLAPLGIQAYELTESCAQIMPRAEATLADVYNDLLNLGRIFDVQTRAETLVAQMRRSVSDVQANVAGKTSPRVFLYDSGEDRPMTAGRLAIPQALISAAGGHNIMADVAASWTHVNWESVVQGNPEVIVIVDYGEVSAAQKQHFLESNPALQSVDAIRNRRYVVLPYVAVTPGLDNVSAIETLAAAFHDLKQ